MIHEIRHILLYDWDPHGVEGRAEAAGTYDGYIEPLVALIRSGAGEDEIVNWLHERELESMCFPSLGTRRLRPVARKLVALRPESDTGGAAYNEIDPG